MFVAGLLPVTLNIFLFDLFLGKPLLPLGATMLFLNIVLVYAYRKYYKFLFTLVPAV
jgi:hypothetical protein